MKTKTIRVALAVLALGFASSAFAAPARTTAPAQQYTNTVGHNFYGQ